MTSLTSGGLWNMEEVVEVSLNKISVDFIMKPFCDTAGIFVMFGKMRC